MKFLLFLLLLPVATLAQMVSLDSLVFDNGVKYSKGDTLILGDPLGEDSTFEYIYYYRGLSGRKTSMHLTDANVLKITKIQKHGEEDGMYLLIVTSEKEDKYTCDIEHALIAGEVITAKHFTGALKYRFTIDDIPLKNGKPYYEEIIEVGSIYSKNQVFKAAKRSLIKLFKDAKEVIQDEDIAEGLIIGKGIKRDYKDKITFTFEIAVKDGKYRIRVYDHYIEWFSEASYIGTTKIGTTGWGEVSFAMHYDEARKGRRFSKNVLKEFHLSNQKIIYSFELLMLDELKGRGDDDW